MEGSEREGVREGWVRRERKEGGGKRRGDKGVKGEGCDREGREGKGEEEKT